MLQILIRDAFKVAPPVAASFSACGRCNGGGQFIGRNGRALGPCFACQGSGRIARRAAPALDAATAVSDEELRAAFDRAAAAGLRFPRITLGEVVIKPAKATGKNPGALYVSTEGDTYLGKIVAGRFQRASACSPEQAQRVAELVGDPKAAIEAYGRETGVCAICNLTLTNPESIERGIGPICAEKWGF